MQKNLKIISETSLNKRNRFKKKKDGNFSLEAVPQNSPMSLNAIIPTLKDASSQKNDPVLTYKVMSYEEMIKKYPVLANKELITQFMAIPLNNNQKGRIRQNLREELAISGTTLQPDVINSKISRILSENPTLNEIQLRRIRLLHNMLKTSLKDAQADKPMTEPSASETETIEKKPEKKSEKKAQNLQRYVVFIGNLPYDVDKEQLMRHFSKITDDIKDVRIPKLRMEKEKKKGGIAYIELKDEKSYQIALSHHHSMFGSRRINVLYTTADSSKMKSKEMKGKVAKMLALQQSGMLLGSTAIQKKRSFRRKRQREALAREKAQLESTS